MISHGHGDEIQRQLVQLAELPSMQHAELILTLNLPSEAVPDVDMWPGPVQVVRNSVPQSFAANHNKAVELAKHDFVALLDPDLDWVQDPFDGLAKELNKAHVGVAAPSIGCYRAQYADHARPAPSIWHIARRILARQCDGIPPQSKTQAVPWLAGLFLAVKRETWLGLGGFDENFRMYAEDIELSLRCWLHQLQVVRTPVLAAYHRPRRDSRRNPRRAYWHVIGLLRLWRGTTWRDYHKVQRRQKRAPTYKPLLP